MTAVQMDCHSADSTVAKTDRMWEHLRETQWVDLKDDMKDVHSAQRTAERKGYEKAANWDYQLVEQSVGHSAE